MCGPSASLLQITHLVLIVADVQSRECGLLGAAAATVCCLPALLPVVPGCLAVPEQQQLLPPLKPACCWAVLQADEGDIRGPAGTGQRPRKALQGWQESFCSMCLLGTSMANCAAGGTGMTPEPQPLPWSRAASPCCKKSIICQAHLYRSTSSSCCCPVAWLSFSTSRFTASLNGW